MSDIQKAIEVFNQGGIVIFPTDTVYGIGCRIDSEKAIKRLFSIRKRPENKPLLALVSNIEMAQQYLEPIPEEVREKIMQKYWPGPLTVLLSCKIQMVPYLVRVGGNILGVRLPKNKMLMNIIEQVGVPIVAPSANFAGGKTPARFEDVDKTLVSLVDYCLVGECGEHVQSTIIDCSAAPWKIVRKGAVKVSI